MTVVSNVTCRSCSHRFVSKRGGGFNYQIMHCWDCGASKSVDNDVLLEYMSDLFEIGKRSLDVLKQGHDQDVAALAECEELAELKKEYTRVANALDFSVLAVVGRCQCGGMYGLNAPSRCPACHSTSLIADPPHMHCD